MVNHIFSTGGRFKLFNKSHTVALKHMIQWTVNEEDLKFCLRRIKNSDGKQSGVAHHNNGSEVRAFLRESSRLKNLESH